MAGDEYKMGVEDDDEKKKTLPEEKTSYALMVFAIVAICLGGMIGLILYYTLPRSEPLARVATVASCQPEHPEGKSSEGLCKDRGCNWQEPSDGAPWCTFPEGYGYTMAGDPEQTTLGYKVTLKRGGHPTLFGDDLETIVLYVEFHQNYRLRLKFADPDGIRYEVPKEAVNITIPDTPPTNATRLYDVIFTREPHFGIKVVRRSTEAVVFDTTVPGLTFSDQYLQMTTKLDSPYVYGFGEHNHRQFQHDMAWKKWSIFTRDVAPVDEWNLYGAQPMYMNMEEDGNANGVLLLNSNAMEVELQPNPHPGITFHVIGGILDFYIFLGPTPENVVQQYTEAVGRPLMPPYWSLGFQLSRWDYDNLTHVKEVVDRNRDAGIPQDVQYGDIDYMESKLGFTYDKDKYKGLPEFVDELHSRGQRYIIILDHCIGSNQTIFDLKLDNETYLPYSEGLDSNIFIRTKEGDILEGEVWPGTVHYPDFTKMPNVTDWWTDQCEDFYYSESWGVEYDALWIDMNEPSNFVPGSTSGCEHDKWNTPPYMPNVLGAAEVGGLYDKTICMNAEQHWGRHYDVHNLYGHSMSITTWQTLRRLWPQTRPLVLTRSQFVGTQKYAAHWLGDNQSLWEHIPWSIIGMLEYSLFGFTYTGADICGFWYEATEEMCQRWTQLGAFYPYARNHNAMTWRDQDPASFSAEMTRVSKDILLTRYKLLPFLYTLMYEGHTNGSTVVRPLLHEYTHDRKTWAIDTQFLWGPSFMISPAMSKGQRYVPIYFPPDRWYDYYGGKEVEPTSHTHNLSTPMDKINLHVRGGHVIPWQVPANTTVLSRRNPMGLLVALGDPPSFQARGSLFWDDGETFETHETGNYLELEFLSKENVLNMNVVHFNYMEAAELTFERIQIWGLNRRPARVYIDDQQLSSSNIDFDSYAMALTLFELGLNITENHKVTWMISS